jgi:hypothetical protein
VDRKTRTLLARKPALSLPARWTTCWMPSHHVIRTKGSARSTEQQLTTSAARAEQAY